MTNLNSNAQRMEDIIEGKQKKTAPKYVGIIIALVLLAACSFGAYSIGQSSGHTAGYDEGYSTGREEGRKAGNKEGYSTGHDEGYDVGYGDGYDAGYDDGTTGVERGKKNQFAADTLNTATKRRFHNSQYEYEKYADIIADGYKTN